MFEVMQRCQRAKAAAEEWSGIHELDRGWLRNRYSNVAGRLMTGEASGGDVRSNAEMSASESRGGGVVRHPRIPAGSKWPGRAWRRRGAANRAHGAPGALPTPDHEVWFWATRKGRWRPATKYRPELRAARTRRG